MKKVITYYSDYSTVPYNSEEDALKAEACHKKINEEYNKNTAKAKFDKLEFELKECLNVWAGTIATCSFDSISIKGMVRVCQKFAEEHKKFLTYY